MKITKQQLTQLLKEEIRNIIEEGHGAHLSMMPAAKTMSSHGIASRPESVRAELMKLVVDLDPQDPEELQQLANMVASLMDASQENIEGDYGLEEGAELKIPVERYDAFKRKIEQWGMLFNKFTGYTADLDLQSFDRKTEGRRIRRMAVKLDQELFKIMKEFDLDYKDYEDERHAQRQKLDRFDGDNEFFLEEKEEDEEHV